MKKEEERMIITANVIYFMTRLEGIIKDIFKRPEIQEKVAQLQGKRIKFFLKREIIREVTKMCLEEIEKINKSGMTKLGRKPYGLRLTVKMRLAQISNRPDLMRDLDKELRKRIKESVKRILSR